MHQAHFEFLASFVAFSSSAGANWLSFFHFLSESRPLLDLNSVSDLIVGHLDSYSLWAQHSRFLFLFSDSCICPVFLWSHTLINDCLQAVMPEECSILRHLGSSLLMMYLCLLIFLFVLMFLMSWLLRWRHLCCFILTYSKLFSDLWCRVSHSDFFDFFSFVLCWWRCFWSVLFGVEFVLCRISWLLMDLGSFQCTLGQSCLSDHAQTASRSSYFQFSSGQRDHKPLQKYSYHQIQITPVFFLHKVSSSFFL